MLFITHEIIVAYNINKVSVSLQYKYEFMQEDLYQCEEKIRMSYYDSVIRTMLYFILSHNIEVVENLQKFTVPIKFLIILHQSSSNAFCDIEFSTWLSK